MKSNMQNAMIRLSNKMRKSDCYVMDKRCHSEKMYPLIRERNEIRFYHTCKRERKRKKISGKYRKQLNLVFDKIKYDQRNIMETIYLLPKGGLEKYLGKKVP